MIFNRRRLFLASCIALITIAMPFAIRTDILSSFGREFNLSHTQQGFINTAAAWGYPLAIMAAGALCDALGMRRLMLIGCAGHISGILLTIFSPAFGYPVLLLATLLIGLSDGAVEAALNPLVATLYPEDKTGKISILHASWPLGLIAGGLICVLVNRIFGLGADGASAGAVSLSWKIKMATVLAGALAYGWLAFSTKFPKTERAAMGMPARSAFLELLRPGFLVLLACMALTAATEVGPDQWIGSVMTDTVGIRGIVFLMYSSVLMLVLRFYGGPLSRLMTPFGLLAASCVLASGGLYWLSHSFTPLMAFAAVTFVALGKTCLWPTLLGVSAEKYPRGGALMFAVLSGVGMIAGGFIGPVMGRVYDNHTLKNLPSHLAQSAVVDGRFSPTAKDRLESPRDLALFEEAEKQGAAMTFRLVALLPVLPFFVYVFMGIRDYKRRKRPPEAGRSPVITPPEAA